MKKTTVLILIFSLILALSACGKTADNDKTGAAQSEITESTSSVSDVIDNSESKSENPSDEWGLSMSFTPLPNNKGTVTFTQSSANGSPKGELTTGEMYTIEKYSGSWQALSYLNNTEPQWYMLAYKIPLNEKYEMDIDYSNIYGTLEAGKYRIVKSVTETDSDGNRTEKTYYAEFTID